LETVLLEENKEARLGAPQQKMPDSLLRPYHEQFLAVFDRLAIDRQLFDDLSGNVGLDLIEQLHGFNDT
jgi:hypothetical protein